MFGFKNRFASKSKKPKERFIYSQDPEDYGYKFNSDTGEYYDPETVGDEEYGLRTWDYNFPDNEDDLYMIKEYLDKTEGPWILAGSLGLWGGRHHGSVMIHSYEELMDAISLNGQYDISINDVDGDFEITVRHHDGTNFFTLRELTKKGKQWYENNTYGRDFMGDYDQNHLVEIPSYTRKVRFADKVFGRVR